MSDRSPKRRHREHDDYDDNKRKQREERSPKKRKASSREDKHKAGPPSPLIEPDHFDPLEEAPKPAEKESVNYEKSGLLAQASNQYKGITLKYAEPPEARVSVGRKWRIYIFKGKELIGTSIHLDRVA